MGWRMFIAEGLSEGFGEALPGMRGIGLSICFREVMRGMVLCRK